MNSSTSAPMWTALLLRLGAQDGDARLEIGRRQVGDQAPLEAAAQPFLERRDELGRPVGRQDDLLAVLVDRVERVEELFLRPFLVGDELDVVDEQQVDAPVARPEVVDLALLDAGDELVGELLAGRVDDALAREARQHLVADGVHQVGLAEAHAAVQEERVVGVAGSLGHGQAGGVGQTVGRADDEVAERVARVEAGAAALRPPPTPAGLEAHGAGSAASADACAFGCAVLVGTARDSPPGPRSRPARCSRRRGPASG